MNKFGKIISLALSAAICAGSVSIQALASEAEETAVNSESAVSVAATSDFSIENYPYSFVKTLDDDEQIKDHIVYNESSKYKSPLSTRTANPGFSIGPGYKNDGLIFTCLSGHLDQSYGGIEKDQGFGNVANIWFTTKSETLYFNPTTGGSVSLPLSQATVGTNKVAFWTKTEKNDKCDRQELDYVTYAISFRNCGASEISVKIPNDGQWHYVVADLAVPFGEGFEGIDIKVGNVANMFGSEDKAVFPSATNGRPVLKLDGRSGVYPVDKLNRPITDIEDAYVLIDGKYVRVRTETVEYSPDPDGIYINIPTDPETPAYYRLDETCRYKAVTNSKGETEYKEDKDGNYMFDIKSGKHIDITNVDFNDRHSITKVESYRVDSAGKQILDDEGNPIPEVICGELVKDIWSQNIYIDEMLFYRTTESGGRTTVLPSGEEDVAYYANTDLNSVLIDGVPVYDIDMDGDNRVISIPQDIDLSNPDLSRFQVGTKCPDVILAPNRDGSTFIPVDISETGSMRSGSTGSITLPSTIDGKAIVTVTSALGTMKEYLFDVKWGYDLSIIATKGTDVMAGGRKTFTIQNYSDQERNVQILAALKDNTTNELKSVAVSNATTGVIPANGSKDVYLSVSLSSITKEEYKNHSIYFYFYDSVTSMNQVASTYVMKLKSSN